MNPTTISEIQSFIGKHTSLQPRGASSKNALVSSEPVVTPVDMRALAGMLEYQPSEYTFTALAGTPLAEIEQTLAEQGQFLPFDPPLVKHGATLGGTVAAGLSGPGRYRFGGVRDFILGVRYIDGLGQLIRSGGKVVKNAAGFDLAKLMVGSLGSYGALVELSFKVFPCPSAYTTLQVDFASLSDGLQALIRLTGTSLELYGLELILDTKAGDKSQPDGSTLRATLVVRLGGMTDSFPPRLERIQGLLNHGGLEQQITNMRVLADEQDSDYWQAYREFSWVPEGHYLVKVPLTPNQVLPFDAKLTKTDALRRYSVGANLVWLTWNRPLTDLESILLEQGLSGLVILGNGGKVRLGVRVGAAFERRVKQALDPAQKWVELE